MKTETPPLQRSLRVHRLVRHEMVNAYLEARERMGRNLPNRNNFFGIVLREALLKEGNRRKVAERLRVNAEKGTVVSMAKKDNAFLQTRWDPDAHGRFMNVVDRMIQEWSAEGTRFFQYHFVNIACTLFLKGEIKVTDAMFKAGL